MDFPAATRTLRRTVERQMVYRTTIQRNQAGGEDSWGGSGEPNWQPHLTDVSCYAFIGTGTGRGAAREPVADRMTVTFVDRRLILERGTDVTEADRIGDVLDRDGALVYEGPMGVEGVIRRRSHIELILERIR